ncbi:MAG: ACP S-malonyltransferase [Gammaproteobacteria bacterium]
MSQQSYNLAFVFPGQGSQSVGMLNGLAASYPEVRHIFERASTVLGKDLWSIIADGPDEALNQTQNTQPAMLAAGYAVWHIWCRSTPVRPTWAAGHSLGEYTALVCSGAISFEDGIKLVAIRGKLMQEAVPNGIGAMAAILGLEDHTVVKICQDASGIAHLGSEAAEAASTDIVSAANFNSPGQVVIAGTVAAVEKAMIAAKEAGAKRAVLLPVSVPSHCALMKPAAESLWSHLLSVTMDKPGLTLIHNVDVLAHTAPDVIRHALKEQMYRPVRWADTIKFMHDQGVTRFVECGPGKVLTGLNKRIAKDAEHFSMFDPESINQVMESLNV